jgi:D-amino-acid oxidase
METLNELHPMGKDSSNSLVEFVPTICLHRKNAGPTTEDFIEPNYKSGIGGASPLPFYASDPRLQFQHLTVEMLWWQNTINKMKIPSEEELLAAGYNHAWMFSPPIVDCPEMLEEMLHEVKAKAADVIVDTGIEYDSIDHLLEDAKSLGCDGVVNCSGLGAKKLCNDSELVGARGILLQYNRKDCIRRKELMSCEDGQDVNILVEDEPWGSEEMPCYMITRGNTIVVGGSYLEGDTKPGLREEERAKLLGNAKLLGIDTEKSSPIGEWAGFRPYRKHSRLELDQDVFEDTGVRLVHSYGYGGSGWTVYVGAAKEATKLMVEKSKH